VFQCWSILTKPLGVNVIFTKGVHLQEQKLLLREILSQQPQALAESLAILMKLHVALASVSVSQAGRSV
jgi:hypothetical protein